MGARVTVSITGQEEVRALLLRVPDVAQNERLYDQISAVMLNRIRARFLRQEAPDGSIWPVSAASLRRARMGRDGGTLYDHGTLFNSIVPYRPAPLTRGIGTDVPYAPYHQEGLGRTQRVFLGFSVQDVEIVEAVVARHVDEWATRENRQ